MASTKQINDIAMQRKRFAKVCVIELYSASLNHTAYHNIFFVLERINSYKLKNSNEKYQYRFYTSNSKETEEGCLKIMRFSIELHCTNCFIFQILRVHFNIMWWISKRFGSFYVIFSKFVAYKMENWSNRI